MEVDYWTFTLEEMGRINSSTDNGIFVDSLHFAICINLWCIFYFYILISIGFTAKGRRF